MATTVTKIAVETDFTGAADGTYRAVSAKLAWSLQNLAAGDGPLIVGYAHSDYTVTEIKEAIEAVLAISVGDLIAQEQANRLVRVVGSLTDEAPQLNDGMPISTKLNWLIPIGKNVEIFAYNDGITMTTGAVVNATGSLWVKDSS